MTPHTRHNLLIASIWYRAKPCGRALCPLIAHYAAAAHKPHPHGAGLQAAQLRQQGSIT